MKKRKSNLNSHGLICKFLIGPKLLCMVLYLPQLQIYLFMNRCAISKGLLLSMTDLGAYVKIIGMVYSSSPIEISKYMGWVFFSGDQLIALKNSPYVTNIY